MNVFDRFAASLTPSDTPTRDDAHAYVEWQTLRCGREFIPTDDDDADLRTYFVHIRAHGANRAALRRNVASLKRLYDWAQAEAIIHTSAFVEYDFDRPFLSREEIRRRQQELTGNPQEREIARLRALNQLAEQLNRSLDVQSALDTALKTLLQVMGLQTAWAFILTSSGIQTFTTEPPHDFALAAASGLPPGLEDQERRFLRLPPDCHCQHLLRNGRIARAVNVVECSRLADAAEASGDNRGLQFHASVPILSQGRLLGILNAATSEWQLFTSTDLQFLSAVGAQVAVTLERAHFYDVAEAQRAQFERELQMAREVQASLLPRVLPDLPGFRLAADWRSAREVAGDFYDIFPLQNGRWGMVIGDVSDKGAPAALYMAMARSLMRAGAARHHSPAAALSYVNDTIITQTTSDMFVTLFYAVLDPQMRTLTYANAGHNPPLVRRAAGEIEQLKRTGLVVGAFEKLHWTEAALSLAPGDALVLYTDGVTDALNLVGQDYGIDRLVKAIDAGPASAPQLLAHLSADLTEFTTTAPQPDDVTLFVISRDPIRERRATRKKS